MKAVILAGGRGERLRPITDTRPKPLVPVLARPVMDYCLSLLSHHGIGEAIVTTHYLADQIRHRYGNEAFGVALSYSQEDTPLGTAGGVKLLEKDLEGEECFLVMSGDALCDFDLSRALDFHKKRRADVTIVLSSVKTPLEYGVVLADTFEKIFAFSEKPDWSETFSDLVNTGVYILSPAILKKIPAGEVFDFSHDLFPLLLREGYSLFGYKDEGYWCDIGKIPTLYRCNLDLLQGKARTYLPFEGRVERTPDGRGSYFVSNLAQVEKGAQIQPGTVISPGAQLADGCRVAGSLVMEKAKIEKGAVALSAVLCEESVLHEGALALPGSVLGAGSAVDAQACTQRDKKYPPHSAVTTVLPFSEEGLVFTEEGAADGNTPGLDKEGAQRLGSAFARTWRSQIGILWDEREAGSAYFATLFAGGVMRGGENAVLLGEGTREMASFAAGDYRIPTVFVSAQGEKGIFFAYEKEGLPLLRRDVLKLSRFAQEEDTNHMTPSGRLLRKGELRENYIRALSEQMGPGGGTKVGFGGNLASILKEAAIKAGFAAYDGTREKSLCLEVFHRGLKLFLNGERLADTEKARLYVIERELRCGRREFVLPRSAPDFFSEHIRTRGGRVGYFSLQHTAKSEGANRAKGAAERWLYDPAFLAARLLSHISSLSQEKIREEFYASPEIYISQLRYYPREENKARLLGIASRIPGENRKIRMEPGFYGIKIISEALSFEAALDNAFEYRGKLNEIEENMEGR